MQIFIMSFLSSLATTVGVATGTLLQYISPQPITSNERCVFRLDHKLLGHSVSVFAKVDAEVQLRVRFSERVVELVTHVIKNIHARGPGDGRCNVQAENESFHLVIRERTARVYAYFSSRSKRRYSQHCIQ